MGISFRQCIFNFNPANLDTTDCKPKDTRPGHTGIVDANGGGSIYVPVYAYGDAQLETPVSIAVNRSPATGNPNAPHVYIPCDAQHDCAIVGVTQGATFVVPISFGSSPVACPQGVFGPQGSGSAAATRAMFKWSASVCQPPRSLPISYATHNEQDAYSDFFRRPPLALDFGVTGLGPYGGAQSGPSPSPSGSATTRGYKLAPLTASGVVLAYLAYQNNLGSQGAQITTLTLTPDLIAKMFMGRLTNFARTKAITDLNPGITFPSQSHLFARADHNSETYIFSSWLSAVAPNTWQPPQGTSPDTFPSSLGAATQLGEREVALQIVDPPNGFDAGVVYIGLMDSSTAAFYGLPTVRIAMPDGSAVSANSDSILEAISDSTARSDGTLVPQWSNSGDPDAWPMPMITYMIAPTDTIDPARGDQLARFLRYAVQDGQTLFTDNDGYVRLPGPLVQVSLAVADKIPVPVPPPTPSPSPAASLPALPSLPPLPAETLPPVSSSIGASSSRTSAGASNSRIAALSYSQGLELAAAAHEEVGPPEKYVLAAVVGLTSLVIVGGLGLQLWARRRARLIAGPRT